MCSRYALVMITLRVTASCSQYINISKSITESPTKLYTVASTFSNSHLFEALGITMRQSPASNIARLNFDIEKISTVVLCPRVGIDVGNAAGKR